MTYKAAVLALSPLAYWRLGEASGTTAVDEVGAFDGTYVGSPTLGTAGALGASGDADTAAFFLNSTQYVTHAEFAMTGAFTWLAWVNPVVIDAASHYWARHGTVNSRWGTVASKVYVQVVPTGSSDNTLAPPSTGAWHFIALTRDASNIVKICIDNVVTTLFSGAAQAGTCSMNRFSSNVSNNANLSLDEVAILDYALTAGQVAALYLAGTTAGFAHSQAVII